MKIIKIIIPTLFLIIAILIMRSNKVLKNAYNGQEIIGIFDEITVDIKANNWDEAISKTKEIKTGFVKISRLIQFSVEREELDEFYSNLARLQGFLDIEDDDNAVATVYVLKNLWEDLG